MSEIALDSRFVTAVLCLIIIMASIILLYRGIEATTMKANEIRVRKGNTHLLEKLDSLGALFVSPNGGLTRRRFQYIL